MNRVEAGVCSKCDGAGWVWWFELDDCSGMPGQQGYSDDTKYSCDWCQRHWLNDEPS